jgi:DNA-binding CsgD family transcriptional regulator/tetratricopeptide (TPR) repeat protein
MDSSPADRYRAQAQSLLRAGRTKEALTVLITAADDLREADPLAAARLLVDAVQPVLQVDGPIRALATAKAADELARDSNTSAEILAITRLGDALAWNGRHREAAEAWRRAAAIPSGPDPAIACERANAALRGGDLHLARDLAYEAVVRSRVAESRDDLLDALNIAAMTEIHVGHLREALDLAEQGQASVDPNDRMQTMDAIGLVAWAAALIGDADRCRSLIAQATAQAEQMRITAPGGFAEGMLALSQARYAEAVRAFRSKSNELPMDPVAQALGLRPYVPSLVEAYARAGRREEAQDLLERFFDAAMATGQPRHAAPALRARGVAHDDREALDRALAIHAAWGNRFEEARTFLARGELDRRLGSRDAARSDLRAARDGFADVGSALWRQRALTELRAAGDRSVAVPTLRGIGPERLSQQEAVVVELVADGLTNRQIADRLYLSVKTVEGHLTTVYGKLGVTSRAQLIAARRDPSPDTQTTS